MRVGILVILSLVTMTLDHRQQYLDSVRSALSTAIHPLRLAINLPFAFGDWASETLASRQSLLDENRQLKEKQLELEFRLQRLATLETENTRLRELMRSSSKVSEHILIAELLAVDFDPFKRQSTINRGANDGVYEGQPVLDARGVMGQVIHVAPYTSTLMLITDPSHAIPVQVNRNGLRAIAQGNGSANVLDIPHIPNNADIRVGDLLITSGLGQRFPRGYPVATVTTVTPDPSAPYARITATPSADLEYIHEVLLVWPEGLEPARVETVGDAEPATTAEETASREESDAP